MRLGLQEAIVSDREMRLEVARAMVAERSGAHVAEVRAEAQLHEARVVTA
ncbi:MAG: hypothetical protein ACYDCL_16550 [Myxococcales bacterium]